MQISNVPDHTAEEVESLMDLYSQHSFEQVIISLIGNIEYLCWWTFSHYLTNVPGQLGALLYLVIIEPAIRS